MFFFRIIKSMQVIDKWSLMIRDGQGKTDEVLDNMKKSLEKTKAPNIKLKEKKIGSGVIRGTLGAKRTFLVVTETKNPRLKPYQMFINVRDYGINLDISWYLTFRIGILRKLLFLLLLIPGLNLLLLPFFFAGNIIRGRKAGLGLDFFDEQDLRAYATNAHHCLTEAVEGLMTTLDQDPSEIDKKSQGFLGIS